MPVIQTFGHFEISIRSGEHGVPHVHVIAADFEAVIAIESCEVLAQNGRFSAIDQKTAMAYITDNTTGLLAEFYKRNPALKK